MDNVIKSSLPVQTDPINLSPSIDESEIDIVQLWRVIKRRKFDIFSITLVCLIIGVLSSLGATSIYRAETKLVVDPIQSNFETRGQDDNKNLVFLFYETQYEIIGSLNIAQKAVDKLGLIARYKAEQAAELKLTEEAAGGGIQQVKAWLFSNKRTLKPALSDEALRANLASGIQDNLNVKGGRQSEIIRISYEDSDPQLAAEITNAIAEAYMEFGLESHLSGAKQISTWLNDRLYDLRANLRKSEDTLQTFQRRQGMVDTNQQERLAGTRLSVLTTELALAQTKRSEAEIRYQQIRSKHESGDYASLSPILNNLIVQSQEQEVIKLSRNVRELAERYGEKYPKMIAARADLNEAKQNLEIEIDRVVDSVRKEYQAASAFEEELSTLIKKEKRELSTIKSSSFKLIRLEREVLNNQKLYESFLGRFQEANASEQYDVSNVQVIDVARTPTEPYRSNKPSFILIIALALVLGLFLGILFAFLREQLDNTFKTTEELEEKLQLPTLGVIPIIKNPKNTASPAYQVIADPRSQFAESVNNIRTGLLFSNIDNPPKTILVTSAIAMEGKSILATNLAASLSQLDRTLLLEVDLRKPSVARYMEITPSPGVADQALNKESILEEAITAIGDEESKLYVMPAGSFTPNPLELLSSDYFKNLLENLKKTFSYIVLDGPPVLAVSDATVISHLVDSVVLAVKAESTKIQMAKESISRLRKSNVRITGAVLCQVDVKRMSNYGSHYYNASYYGYSDATKEGALAKG